MLQVLSDQLEAGRVPPFTVDPKTGEPVIDLRELERHGLLHLVKRVSRNDGSSSGENASSAHKTLSVELYSSKDAADSLARIFGMDRGGGSPELPPRVVGIQKYVRALLQDPEEARLADRQAAKVAALMRGEKV